jgi:hypothetical protein
MYRKVNIVHGVTNNILWQTDGATQRPDMDSDVSYATVFRMHQRRLSLGNDSINDAWKQEYWSPLPGQHRMEARYRYNE